MSLLDEMIIFLSQVFLRMAVLLTKNKIERSRKGLEPKTVEKYSSILATQKTILRLPNYANSKTN